MGSRRLVVVLSLAALVAGCAGRQRVQPPPRAEGQGAIYAYVQPLPGRAGSLALSIRSVSAQRADGLEVALTVRLPEMTTARATNQRLLAVGAVPPGSYGGLRLELGRPALAGSAGQTPEETFLVTGPFVVVKDRAAVLWLSVRDEQLTADTPLSAAFALSQAHQAIPEQAGVAVNARSHDATVFDVLRKQVTGALLLDGSPGGVALDPVARRLYVSLPARDELRSFDLATGDPLDVLKLRPGDSPGPLALVPGGSLLLAVEVASRTVSFIDRFSFVEQARLPVGDLPVSILVDRTGSRAFVFNRRSNSITVIDISNAAVASTVPTDPEPLLGSLDRTGTRLAVVYAGSMYASMFSLPDLSVASRFFVGLGASAVQVDQRTNLVYVATRDRLQVFSSLSPMPIGGIAISGEATRLPVEDVDSTMFALMTRRDAIQVIDIASGRTVAELDTGEAPVDLAIAGERR